MSNICLYTSTDLPQHHVTGPDLPPQPAVPSPDYEPIIPLYASAHHWLVTVKLGQ